MRLINTLKDPNPLLAADLSVVPVDVMGSARHYLIDARCAFPSSMQRRITRGTIAFARDRLWHVRVHITKVHKVALMPCGRFERTGCGGYGDRVLSDYWDLITVKGRRVGRL